MENGKMKKQTFLYRFLKKVEIVGNKLPHPFFLFVGLVAIVIFLSLILSKIGIQVKHPVKDEIVVVKNLLSREGIRYMILNLLNNFTSFRPLGLVLSMMIGIGLAEQAGLMSAFMRKFILGAPEKLLIMSIFLIGICGNIASDASIIIVPPLAGAIFYGAKKNPIVGVAAGYAAACAGFTANLLIAGTDALLAGITEEAAHIIDPSITVSPLVNYYFMFVSTILLSIVGTWITKRYVEKQAGEYIADENIQTDINEYQLSESESKGLRRAGLITLIYWGIIIIALIPKNSVLRADDGGIISGTFIKGIIPFILFWFIAVGIGYGRKAGTIKQSADIPKLMSKAMAGMASYIVIVFVIAQFVNFFNWTNLGLVLAVNMANLMKATNFTGLPMVIGVLFITMFINLFLGSGSAKWALLSPVFVPMFMMLGYSPEFAQIAYRIGDSTTNAISPLFPYIAIVLGFMQKYKKDAGLGTLFSLLLPYTIGFGLIWILQIAVWFIFKLPLGPGASIFM
ncbi:AbgT family transporter [Maledivibacter halophilus]|uniref:Aminobenzoyl-glutamate transport protein n=1 Tax=Maledivibacter halophilus TaxID=36842 RepID=A0A1T5J279_9FIRM|nr:AbgT family transporter [Maledivibacter halophilus]SKC45617.1 aminobenzoyl-glutamate transport protein [Maledivibacter halophilus]